jgi:hypothetical protein
MPKDEVVIWIRLSMIDRYAKDGGAGVQFHNEFAYRGALTK